MRGLDPDHDVPVRQRRLRGGFGVEVGDDLLGVAHSRPRDVDQREERSMRVRKREQQSPHLVADIEIPANLEAVQCFERTAEQQENKKRPPAEPQISVGLLRSLGAGRSLHYSDRMIRLSSRSF